ncbi:MAG: hypothetical protein IJ971_02655 [Bacteroidales bacterium]|nr:hypothetical protein [Bacteroidales bacterium]
MKRILLSALIVVIAISCKKDDTLRYNNLTMGNIVGETIVSDQGNTFDIAETLLEVDLQKFKYGRVLLMCDVLKKTSENRYDIRLTGIESVLTKDVLTQSEITEDKLMVEDAINIRDIWYGGGYLNLFIEIAQKKDSETKHMINLVYDDQAKEEGYVFILRHNAFGETPSEEDKGYRSASGYVSFPIAGLIKEDSADITMKWKSHTRLPEGDYSQTKEITHQCKWNRIGYEHNIPQLKASKAFRVM